jgi:hypothetical protein
MNFSDGVVRFDHVAPEMIKSYGLLTGDLCLISLRLWRHESIKSKENDILFMKVLCRKDFN